MLDFFTGGMLLAWLVVAGWLRETNYQKEVEDARYRPRKPKLPR